MTQVVYFKSPIINTKSYLKKIIVISVYKSQNLKPFVGKTFFLSDLNYSYNLQQKYDKAVISSWLLQKN